MPDAPSNRTPPTLRALDEPHHQTLAIARSPQQAVPASIGTLVSVDTLLAETGQLAHYRFVKQLGRGGMGVVFLAEDTKLCRPVALKVMLGPLVAQPEARERFLREARAAAAVKHDHVVTIYEVDEEHNIPFIVMEFLRGNSLEHYLDKKGPPGWGQVLRLAREMAAGLAAAHERGLIHRDIKPANVFLEAPGGRVKLLDFGLARFDDDDTMRTEVGAVMGTPAYMAPEQAAGQRVDQRADLYSLGAVLYTVCTRRPPFLGPTPLAVLTALAVERPKPVEERNPEVPPALAELIGRLLARRPEDRPQTANEVGQALRAIERPRGPKGDGEPSLTMAPMEVEVEPEPTLPVSDETIAAPTEHLAAPQRKRRRRTRAHSKHNWTRLIGRLVAGLALVVVCIVLIHAATRPGSPASRTEGPDKGTPTTVPKPAADAKPTTATPTRPEPINPEPGVVEPKEGPGAKEFPPLPPPKKEPFPPLLPPKKGPFRTPWSK